MPSSTVQPITPNNASAIIGARCTPAAQCTYNFASSSFSADSANSTPRENTSGGFGSKSSSTGFQQTAIPCGSASSVSSNSICISMMCVIPVRDTSAIFSAVQIPPPTAIRSVTHVMSILIPSRLPVLLSLLALPDNNFPLKQIECESVLQFDRRGFILRYFVRSALIDDSLLALSL